MALTFAPVAKASSGPANVDVPDDVAAELAEVYAYLSEHPTELMSTEFASKAELDTFTAQARRWAADNDLVFRISRWDAKPSDLAIRFNIRPPLSDEEKAQNVRESKDETAAPAKAPAKPKGK